MARPMVYLGTFGPAGAENLWYSYGYIESGIYNMFDPKGYRSQCGVVVQGMIFVTMCVRL